MGDGTCARKGSGRTLYVGLLSVDAAARDERNYYHASDPTIANYANAVMRQRLHRYKVGGIELVIGIL
jgi:hypothetical protein